MIYRIHILCDQDESEGYRWFTTRQAAREEVARLISEEGGEYDMTTADIHAFDTPRTKREWVEFLNEWASHPDNG